jgi:hypothetical protein
MSEHPAHTGQFEPITGRWKGRTDFDLDPPVRIEGESGQKRLGEFLVTRSHAEGPGGA